MYDEIKRGLEGIDLYYSYYKAEILEIDYKNSVRVKVKVPEVYSSIKLNIWVYPLNYNSKNYQQNLPLEVGNFVYIVYIKGNSRIPFYINTVQNIEFNQLQEYLHNENLSEFQSCFSSLIYSLYVGINEDTLKVKQGKLTVTMTNNLLEVGVGRKSSMSVLGDDTRANLNSLNNNIAELTKEVVNLSTALNTFIAKSSVLITPILPPYAEIGTVATISIQTINAALTKIQQEAVLIQSDISKNISESLKHD